jgi:hypothetical protein
MLVKSETSNNKKRDKTEKKNTEGNYKTVCKYDNTVRKHKLGNGKGSIQFRVHYNNINMFQTNIKVKIHDTE